MESDSAYSLAYADALRRVSRREHSRLELEKALLRQGHEVSVIRDVLSRLEELRYVDDQRFAQALTRAQGARGKGPAYILQKLKAKGVSLSVEQIRAIVEEREGRSELERAHEIVQRRYARYREDPAIAKRAFDALVRRGFSFEVARQVLRR
jgi:regulatory protein